MVEPFAHNLKTPVQILPLSEGERKRYKGKSIKELQWEASGLYYKSFTIVIYERNAIGQYYKTMIEVKANYDRS